MTSDPRVDPVDELLDALGLAVLELDEGWIVRRCTRAVARLFELPTVPARGLDIHDLEGGSTLVSIVDETIGELGELGEGSWERTLGPGLAVRITAARVSSRAARSVWCWRFEASRAPAELRELARAKEAAEAANLAKTKFLAVVSHEMRTPLNAILGMTALALDDASSARQREYLATVQSSADGLLSLIDDILDFTTVESVGARFQPEPIELSGFVDRLLQVSGTRANDAGLELFASVSATAPSSFVADRQRLRQILGNLIDNAVKFTKRGHIEVGVDVEGSPGEELLRVSVRDTGEGIASADLERIFEPFHQRSPQRRQGGGVGLGLSICRSLVERMGGRIWASAGPERGSVFHVELPLERGPAPAPELGELAVARVFVVSPVEALARASCSRLARLGVVASVGHGPLGIEAALTEQQPASWMVLVDEELGHVQRQRLLAMVESRAEARVVVLARPRSDRFDRAAGYRVIDKPVTASALRELLVVEPQRWSPRAEPASASSGHVLVVEDDIHSRTYAQRALALDGFVVDTAEDAEAGLTMARTLRYDLVLTDLGLPGMSGIELAVALRELERSVGRVPTPIVALSAHSIQEFEERCHEAGMDDFVTKPIRRQDLLAVTRRHTGTRLAILALESVELDPEVREALLVHTAADTHRAAEVLRNELVSVVFVDLDNLDRGDASDAVIFAIERFAYLLGALHDSDESSTRRVVGVCADPERYTELLDSELVTDLVVRPVTLAVARAMLSGDSFEPAPAPEPAVDSSSAALAARDEQPVVIDELVADLADDFLDSRRRELASLAALAAAEDFQGIAGWGHSLKGSAGNYGFMALSKLGHELVSAARREELDAVTRVVSSIAHRLATVRWVPGSS